MKLTRRQALLASTLGIGGLALSWISDLQTKKIPGGLVGASSTLGHRLRQGNFPVPSQVLKTPLVIIGGGIAGLAAGYRLQKKGLHDFVLLELEAILGGHSASGRNATSAYPWGAHYVPLLTDEALEVKKLFEELGVITGYGNAGLPIYNELYICADPHERLHMFGRWQEGLIPVLGISKTEDTQFKRFFALMEDFKQRRGTDGKRWFAIPVDQSSGDAMARSLDTISMKDWLEQNNFNSPRLAWYVDYCCRDDFGTRTEHTSAWAGIHYFAARSGQAANTAAQNVLTWPEGNGWLVNKLAAPNSTKIKNQALVFKLAQQKNDVEVDYWDAAAQRSIRIQTQAVIMATPRFVAQRLLPSLPAADMHAFSYAPWAVANISLRKLPVGKGVPLSWDNVNYAGRMLGYVVATHQIPQMKPLATVLTYYWPLSHLPPAAARKEALQRSYVDWQNLFVRELLKIHPELEGHIEQVDVCVWGHAMIRPTPGFIWGAARQRALRQHAPIFYAHSDMSGISIFEEAYTHGVHAAEAAHRYLTKT